MSDNDRPQDDQNPSGEAGKGRGSSGRSGRWSRPERPQGEGSPAGRSGAGPSDGRGSRGGDNRDNHGGGGYRSGERDTRGGGSYRSGARDTRGGDSRGGYRSGERDPRGGDNRGGDNRGGGYRSGDRDTRGGDDRGGGGYRSDDRDTRGGDSRGGGYRSGDRDSRGGGGYRFGDRDSRGADNRGGGGYRSADRDTRGGDNRGNENRSRPGFADRRDEAPRGPRSWDRRRVSVEEGKELEPRGKREPVILEGITGKELDRSVWVQLRTLTKENAEGVAQHLVATAMLLEDDPEAALDHALHVVRRAARVPAAREALGLVLYRRGEFAEALREFRTARRLSGSNHLLPYMVDCERGLGRPDRALELAASPEAKTLGEADNIELAIVVSGVRRDLNQPEAALVGLRIPALTKAMKQPWAARLFYAYADALLGTGDEQGAHEWFSKALGADSEGETDAGDRLAELEGLVVEDLDMDDGLDDDVDEQDLDGPDHADSRDDDSFGEPTSTPHD